jgi:hypothetical protein
VVAVYAIYTTAHHTTNNEQQISPHQTGTAATSQPLHIQPPLAVFINFNQLLILTITFCNCV